MLSFFSVLDTYSKKQLHRGCLPNLSHPMVPKAQKGGLYQATLPCALPAEVAAFLSVIVKCRSSRLMGPYRVPSGFSTAGSAMSSEGMTEFFLASVNSSWAFLHIEAWEKSQVQNIGSKPDQSWAGVRMKRSQTLRLSFQRCDVIHTVFAETSLVPESLCLSARQISYKVCPWYVTRIRETQQGTRCRRSGKYHWTLAMSWYEVCPQEMLKPELAVSLSSGFIWLSLGTTSRHTAFDLVKDEGVTAILLLLLLLSFVWTGPVEFLLIVLLWKLYSYIL